MGVLESYLEFNLHIKFFFLSKYELYSMEWPYDTELEQMKVAAAPYGGPMAIVRDSKEFIKVGGSSTVKPVIRIFTTSGHLLSTINVIISHTETQKMNEH